MRALRGKYRKVVGHTTRPSPTGVTRVIHCLTLECGHTVENLSLPGAQWRNSYCKQCAPELPKWKHCPTCNGKGYVSA